MADNSSFICGEHVLYAYEVMSEASTAHKVLLIIAVVLTTLTCIIFLESAHYMRRKIPDKLRRNKMVWIMSLHPVFSITSCIGLYVPRAAVLCNFVAAMYLSITLYVFLSLLVDYYGGVDKMHAAFDERTIKLNTLPVMCCCVCLPKVKLAENSKLLRRLVLQNAIIRPAISFIAAVLWLDGRYTPGTLAINEPFMWFCLISVISTATAMQAIGIIQVASTEPLAEYKITLKTMCIQLALLFTNIQLGFVRLSSTIGLLPCKDPFGEVARIYNVYNILVVIEFFFISFFTRVIFRTRRMGNAEAANSSEKELEAGQRDVKYECQETPCVGSVTSDSGDQSENSQDKGTANHGYQSTESKQSYF